MTQTQRSSKSLPVDHAWRRRAEVVGKSSTWLCAAAVSVTLFMILGLGLLLLVMGMATFWQRPVVELTLTDGTKVLGEPYEQETVDLGDERGERTRSKLKIGNRELNNQLDFRWVEEADIRSRELPAEVVVVERLIGGNFYGRVVEIRRGEKTVAEGIDEYSGALERIRDENRPVHDRIDEVNDELGDISSELEDLRLDEVGVRRRMEPGPEREARLQSLDSRSEELKARSEVLQKERTELEAELAQDRLVVRAVDGTETEIEVPSVVRVVQPNELGLLDKVGLYVARLWEFLTEEPRDANRSGGILPAILGTVLMVFLMTFVVTPFGVLAAIYLREYARQGLAVRLVRIAVNNLAGVPSIVFGVVGLGFFVYIVGGTIDGLFFQDRLPTATYGTGNILWAALTLALLTVPVVIVATEEGLAAVPKPVREGSLALGSTKWETIRKVVLPAAAPGILTGIILAISRAAGEVAPLMLVGMVKMAPDFPLDGDFPFLHLERKFMHLGFHIYDLGYQSPDVEASKPLVFTTALVLVLLVVVMNFLAIRIRNHLRDKYATSAV